MITNLEEIKARSDIVEVISSYIPLRKEGMNYKACCPFHNEKSPSFIVSPLKQIYTCFGCGESGDVFSFVMKHRHLSFDLCVTEIADMSNIEVVSSNVKGFKKSSYIEVNSAINDLFKENLHQKENEKIVKYLINRGLSIEDFNTYDIGVIPESVKIVRMLENIPGGVSKALEIGALYRSETQRIYSPYINRISFALRDENYKVIGFSNRIHPYHDFKNNAKYINSKESRVFQKSSFLYNINRARTPIIKANSVYIVEGFMDSIALNILGVKNNLATCGTAFNDRHLSVIYKISPSVEIKLLFDSDDAGQRAMFKTLELLFRNNNFNIKALKLKSSHKDIGEVLESKVPLDLEEKDGFLWHIEYMMKDANTPKEKDEVLKVHKDIISSVSNFYTKEHLIDIASSYFGIKKQELISKSIPKATSLPTDEEILLKAILIDPRGIDLAIEYIDGDMLPTLKDDYIQYTKDAKVGDFTPDKILDNEVLKSLNDTHKKLICNEDIPIIKIEELPPIISRIAKSYYQKRLDRAVIDKDIKQILYLREKLKGI